MNTVPFGQVLLGYFKRKGRTLLLIGAFIFLYLVVYDLYEVSVEPALYASLLCLVAALAVAGYDFYCYYRRQRELTRLQKAITVDTGALPQPEDLLEAQYQELIHILYEDCRTLETKENRRREELNDYYTLWTHQIKTPLSAMHLILQSHPEDELRAALEQELFKTEQYAEMALQFLRLDSMSSDLLIRRCNLAELVRKAVKKYAVLFVHSNVSLQLGNLDCVVVTDEKWLVFVLEQLVSNALKYTVQGSISILLHPTRPQTLVIEDTGIGIRPEDIPRIFERGFTGKNGRMDQKSTGIGLYLCRRILNRLSHQIELESEVSKGTRVLLDLSSDQLELT